MTKRQHRRRSNPDGDIEQGCRYYLTIAAIFQNEARYLREWIEFHKMMGVEHFILINDRSTDNFRQVLKPYVADGDVQLLSCACPRRWRGKRWTEYQRSMLDEFCKQLYGVSRWVAFIDLDEFIVPTGDTTLVEFLAKNEHCGGVYVPWEPFGTSFIQRLADDDLLTERLNLKWKFIKGHEMLGKSIVKPHRVRVANIHKCDLLRGYPYLHVNPGMEHDLAELKIHHYWSRDENYLVNEKLPRAAAIKGWTLTNEEIEFFRRLFNDAPDDKMKRFSSELRRRVFPSHP